MATTLSAVWAGSGHKGIEPESGAPEQNQVARMPHLEVDREQGVVDIDARVVLRECAWLELLACLPGTRTHESVLVVLAKPSHVHLGLLMLGLEPGAPMHWWMEGNESKSSPPHGPRVMVSIVQHKDGQEVERPANQWIIDKTTGQTMGDHVWLFTGSGFGQGGSDYYADVSGSVISIVNFGDEVLARSTDKTNENDGGVWVPNTPLIPEVGSEVIIRLRAVGQEDAP